MYPIWATKSWAGRCPASDKEKRFLCSILEFVAVHDFSFRKGPGFKLKEMGVDGQGSLEPGVASGDEFVHGYPSPFLEYYYYANRGELSADLRKQLYPGEQAASSPTDARGEEGGEKQEVEVKQEKERPPIFEHFELISSEVATGGPKRGTYTNKYKCPPFSAGGRCIIHEFIRECQVSGPVLE